jgi:hypothetical protein
MRHLPGFPRLRTPRPSACRQRSTLCSTLRTHGPVSQPGKAVAADAVPRASEALLTPLDAVEEGKRREAEERGDPIRNADQPILVAQHAVTGRLPHPRCTHLPPRTSRPSGSLRVPAPMTNTESTALSPRADVAPDVPVHELSGALRRLNRPNVPRRPPSPRPHDTNPNRRHQRGPHDDATASAEARAKASAKDPAAWRARLGMRALHTRSIPDAVVSCPAWHALASDSGPGH